MKSDESAVIDWLYKVSGCIVKYNLYEEGVISTADTTAKRCVMQLEYIHDLIKMLSDDKTLISNPQYGFPIHHSRPSSFENITYKLHLLGIRYGMIDELDRKLDMYHTCFIGMKNNAVGMNGFLMKLILAYGLTIMGYRSKHVISFVERRIEYIVNFIRMHDYDIYEKDKKLVKSIPKKLKNKYPMIKSSLTVGGEISLPYLYDIHMFASYYDESKLKQIIDDIVTYCLHDDYYSLHPGYGYLQDFSADNKRYLVVGWSVHLSGYNYYKDKVIDWKTLIHDLLLLSRFNIRERNKWAAPLFDVLETYRNNNIYSFPKNVIQEKKAGYAIKGAYMGIEENRKSRLLNEIESTYYMCILKKRYNMRIDA